MGGGETPLHSGRIANGCDYRRLVTQDENLNDCRDANEDHGLGYDVGCNKAYESQIGKVIPETDNFCWELTKFGYAEGDNDEDSEDNDEDNSEDNDEDNSEDNDEGNSEDNDEDSEDNDEDSSEDNDEDSEDND